MKNINKEGENVSENFDQKQMKKLVVWAAVGLKLGRKIYDKLEKIEDSLEILARQKARELNPDEADDVKAK